MARMIAIITVAAAFCLGQVKLVEDPPVAPPPRSGSISGTITSSQVIAEVYACNRNTGKTYPGTLDKTKGGFTVKDLPGDTTYDIGIKLAGGRVIEGIDLEPLDQRMLRLADLRRKQLGVPAEEAHSFGQFDVDELLKFAVDMRQNDFMDQGRVLYLQGHGRRATMLVELLRTREFYDQKKGADGAQLIWRTELWYFEYQAGGWERVQNQERVLRRERLASGKWSQLCIEYLPELSIYVASDGRSKNVVFTVPDKPDPSVGRAAGTEPMMKTDPHILGLPAATTKASAAQTKPAEE